MALQDTINNLTAKVTAQDSVVASVETTLQGLAQMVRDLRNQTTDPAMLAAIDALADHVDQNSNRIANAVTANATP